MNGFSLRGMKLDFKRQLAPEGWIFLQNRECKVRVGVSAHLCILTTGISVWKIGDGRGRCVRESGIGSETGEREKTMRQE